MDHRILTSSKNQVTSHCSRFLTSSIQNSRIPAHTIPCVPTLLCFLRDKTSKHYRFSAYSPSPITSCVCVCLPHYYIAKHTTMKSSEKATFLPSFYGNERISAAYCLIPYCNIAENNEVHIGVFESSSVNRLCLEDDR